MWRGLLIICLLAAVPVWAGDYPASGQGAPGSDQVSAGVVRLQLYPDFSRRGQVVEPEERLLPFGKPFDRRDKELVALSSLLLAVDWAQTLNLSRQPECYCETNAILGEHPDSSRVNAYFASALVGNLALSRLLEGKWRRAWLWTISALQLGVTRNNESIGLQIRF